MTVECRDGVIGPMTTSYPGKACCRCLPNDPISQASSRMRRSCTAPSAYACCMRRAACRLVLGQHRALVEVVWAHAICTISNTCSPDDPKWRMHAGPPLPTLLSIGICRGRIVSDQDCPTGKDIKSPQRPRYRLQCPPRGHKKRPNQTALKTFPTALCIMHHCSLEDSMNF